MAPTRSAAPALALARLLGTEPQSAESLADRLGISASAVTYRVRSLQALGVAVVRERGRGLRLLQPLEWLNSERLQREMAACAPVLSVEVQDECSSTSSLLAERWRSGSASGSMIPNGTVISCEYQSAGRGRRGRRWFSGIASALTFSLLWRFDPPTALSGLPLAVAVALSQALEGQGCTGIELKWPNDLLHAGRKFGGILVETAGPTAPGAGSAVIIGVGINLRLGASLAERIDRPATDLQSAWGAQGLPDRTGLLITLLAGLAEALARYQARGFGAFREEWLRRHAHQGRRVSLRIDDRLVAEGEAAGVDEDGALLLRSGQGLQRILSGEVSLR